jgi:hypothetical protein
MSGCASPSNQLTATEIAQIKGEVAVEVSNLINYFKVSDFENLLGLMDKNDQFRYLIAGEIFGLRGYGKTTE